VILSLPSSASKEQVETTMDRRAGKIQGRLKTLALISAVVFLLNVALNDSPDAYGSFSFFSSTLYAIKDNSLPKEYIRRLQENQLPAEGIVPPAEEITPPTEVIAPADEIAPLAEEIDLPTEEITPPAEGIAPPTEETPPPAEGVAPPTEEIAPSGGDVIDAVNDNVEVAERPIMYTYWNKEEIDEIDRLGLELWIEAWSNAGWKPTVLRLEHAKAHPDYEEWHRMLTLECPYSEYDVGQFFRFLAMNVIGGGWLSSHDVFPLNQPSAGGHHGALPNGGEFTLYQEPNFAPGTVRSLASGTAKEWNRIAHEIYYTGVDYCYDGHRWNDFYAITSILKKDPFNSIHVEDGVVEGRTVLTGQTWETERDCATTNGKLAVHFSSDSYIRGKLREHENPESDHHVISNSWLNMWATKCQTAVPFPSSA